MIAYIGELVHRSTNRSNRSIACIMPLANSVRSATCLECRHADGAALPLPLPRFTYRQVDPR